MTHREASGDGLGHLGSKPSLAAGPKLHVGTPVPGSLAWHWSDVALSRSSQDPGGAQGVLGRWPESPSL